MKPVVRQPERSFTQSIRSQLYDALAQTLADPTVLAGLPRESLLAEAVIAGAAELGSAACRRALFALDELPPIAGVDLRRRYEAVTTRPGHRPLALYESLATTGHLVSPVAQEVERLYRQWGLLPDEELPDSASVELAFLAFLAELEAEAHEAGKEGLVRQQRNVQRDFLQEHAMRWLPQLGRALAASQDPYFVPVGQLLEEFLCEEQLRLLTSHKGATKADIPFVVSGDRCSLCGFCVQTCPTGALWVGENDDESSLLLNPARCIGCAKCLPVCPDDALRMIARTDIDRADLARSPILLHRSERAHCPRCGGATVSRAELNAVYARLEANSHLRYRLSLCNRCKGS